MTTSRAAISICIHLLWMILSDEEDQIDNEKNRSFRSLGRWYQFGDSSFLENPQTGPDIASTPFLDVRRFSRTLRAHSVVESLAFLIDFPRYYAIVSRFTCSGCCSEFFLAFLVPWLNIFGRLKK